MQLFAENPHIYTAIRGKPMCTPDCEGKTRVQEEKEIKKKANRQAETKFTLVRHYWETMPQTRLRNREIRAIQEH